MIKKIAMAAASLTFLSSSVFAADAEYSSTWSGVYVGAFLGYGWTDYDADHEREIGGEGEEIVDTEAESVLYGGNIGLNLQSGQIIYGLETDITFGTGKTSMNALEDDPCISDCYSSEWPLQVEDDVLATLRARVGYEVMPSVMMYATGGFAYRQTSLEIPDENNNAYSFDSWGYAVGAGAEYKFTEHASIKAEYIFHGFDENYDIRALEDGDEGDFLEIRDVHVVRMGVNYTF